MERKEGNLRIHVEGEVEDVDKFLHDIYESLFEYGENVSFRTYFENTKELPKSVKYASQYRYNRTEKGKATKRKYMQKYYLRKKAQNENNK